MIIDWTDQQVYFDDDASTIFYDSTTGIHKNEKLLYYGVDGSPRPDLVAGAGNSTRNISEIQ